MNKEKFKQVCDGIYNFTDKFGEMMYDKIDSSSNFSGIIGKYTIRAFSHCQTEREFQIADEVLTAICGWNFESLVELINKRDADPNFYWMSCDKEDFEEELEDEE